MKRASEFLKERMRGEEGRGGEKKVQVRNFPLGEIACLDLARAAI